MIWPRQFCRLETMRMAHVNFKFLHLAFKIVSSAIIFIFSLERSENSQLQIPNQQRTVQHFYFNLQEQQQRETQLFFWKKDRRWYLFPVSTLGAVYFAVHGGTGRFLCFFEAGRGGGVFCRGGTGWLFIFSEAGRGGFFFFFRRDGTGRCLFFFRGPGRDGCFWRWQFFGRDGANRYTVPPKAV